MITRDDNKLWFRENTADVDIKKGYCRLSDECQDKCETPGGSYSDYSSFIDRGKKVVGAFIVQI